MLSSVKKVHRSSNSRCQRKEENYCNIENIMTNQRLPKVPPRPKKFEEIHDTNIDSTLTNITNFSECEMDNVNSQIEESPHVPSFTKKKLKQFLIQNEKVLRSERKLKYFDKENHHLRDGFQCANSNSSTKRCCCEKRRKKKQENKHKQYEMNDKVKSCSSSSSSSNAPSSSSSTSSISSEQQLILSKQILSNLLLAQQQQQHQSCSCFKECMAAAAAAAATAAATHQCISGINSVDNTCNFYHPHQTNSNDNGHCYNNFPSQSQHFHPTQYQHHCRQYYYMNCPPVDCKFQQRVPPPIPPRPIKAPTPPKRSPQISERKRVHKRRLGKIRHRSISKRRSSHKYKSNNMGLAALRTPVKIHPIRRKNSDDITETINIKSSGIKSNKTENNIVSSNMKVLKRNKEENNSSSSSSPLNEHNRFKVKIDKKKLFNHLQRLAKYEHRSNYKAMKKRTIDIQYSNNKCSSKICSKEKSKKKFVNNEDDVTDAMTPVRNRNFFKIDRFDDEDIYKNEPIPTGNHKTMTLIDQLLESKKKEKKRNDPILVPDLPMLSLHVDDKENVIPDFYNCENSKNSFCENTPNRRDMIKKQINDKFFDKPELVTIIPKELYYLYPMIHNVYQNSIKTESTNFQQQNVLNTSESSSNHTVIIYSSSQTEIDSPENHNNFSVIQHDATLNSTIIVDQSRNNSINMTSTLIEETSFTNKKNDNDDTCIVYSFFDDDDDKCKSTNQPSNNMLLCSNKNEDKNDQLSMKQIHENSHDDDDEKRKMEVHVNNNYKEIQSCDTRKKENEHLLKELRLLTSTKQPSSTKVLEIPPLPKFQRVMFPDGNNKTNSKLFAKQNRIIRRSLPNTLCESNLSLSKSLKPDAAIALYATPQRKSYTQSTMSLNFVSKDLNNKSEKPSVDDIRSLNRSLCSSVANKNSVHHLLNTSSERRVRFEDDNARFEKRRQIEIMECEKQSIKLPSPVQTYRTRNYRTSDIDSTILSDERIKSPSISSSSSGYVGSSSLSYRKSANGISKNIYENINRSSPVNYTNERQNSLRRQQSNQKDMFNNSFYVSTLNSPPNKSNEVNQLDDSYYDDNQQYTKTVRDLKYFLLSSDDRLQKIKERREHQTSSIQKVEPTTYHHKRERTMFS
ncbi:hypothetical protein SNEBB_002912 [Seison nebaliae]|nr:hypothetical protein SNEBB_002912 [Seison nebaliae]